MPDELQKNNNILLDIGKEDNFVSLSRVKRSQQSQ